MMPITTTKFFSKAWLIAVTSAAFLMSGILLADPPVKNSVPLVVPESASPAYWVGSSTVSASPSAPLLAGELPTCPGPLPWHDEFSGSSLDRTLWDYRIDAKFGSAQLPENVSVEGGG